MSHVDEKAKRIADAKERRDEALLQRSIIILYYERFLIFSK